MLNLNRLRNAPISSKLIRIVRLVGFFLTIFSFALTLYQGVSEFFLGAWQKFVVGLLVGWSAYGASFGLQGVSWCLLIGALSQTRVGWHDLEIYAYSNLVRRTPGVIWYLIERLERYQQIGLDALVTLRASLIEWVLLILSAVFVYVATLGNQHTIPLLIFAGFIVGLGAASAVIRYRDGHFSILANLSFSTTVSSRLTLFLIGVVYSICYVFGGVIVFVLVRLVDPISPLSLIQAINLWALVGGMGLLTSVFIPINVGVREITLVVVLLPFTTTIAAITITAMMRVVFASADVVFSIGTWWLSRWFRLQSAIRENKRDILR